MPREPEAYQINDVRAPPGPRVGSASAPPEATGRLLTPYQQPVQISGSATGADIRHNGLRREIAALAAMGPCSCGLAQRLGALIAHELLRGGGASKSARRIRFFRLQRNNHTQ